MTTARWQQLALAGCLCLMVGTSLRSVGEDFLYGHKGWCAARRAVAGRNFVRHGFVAAKFGPVENMAPNPTRQSFRHYWHHPVGIHLLVGASFSVLGIGEWQARLVPVLLMLAAFLLFADLARRWWPSGPGRWAAMIFFATTPMLAYYGPFVNQEPLVLLACLASVWTYTRWRETLDDYWIKASAVLAAASAWSDWPWFLFAFFMALIAVGPMLRRRRLDLRWLAPFCVAVLAGLIGVVWHLSELQGGDDFFKAFRDVASFRQSGKGKTLATVFNRQTNRWLELFTPTLVLASFAWVPLAVRDARRGRWTMKHSVATAFLALGGGWVAIFKHGAWVHDYWPMFAAVFVVIAGADIVVALSALALRAARWRPGGPWPARVATGVAGVLILTQAVAGLSGTAHRLEYADSNVKEGEDFRRRYAVMARWVRDHTDQSNVIAVDKVITKATFQLGFYLDRTRRKLSLKDGMTSLRVGNGTDMVVIDLRRAPHDTLPNLAAGIVRNYPVTILDDFLIVDRRRRVEEPEVTCLRLVPHPAPWWHTWLVSPIYPPQTLERDPWLEAELLQYTGHEEAALARRATATAPETIRQHVAAHNLARLAGERPEPEATWLGSRGTLLKSPINLGGKVAMLGYTIDPTHSQGEVVEVVFRVLDEAGDGWRPFFNRHSRPVEADGPDAKIPMIARMMRGSNSWEAGELITIRTYSGLNSWRGGVRYQVGFWRPQTGKKAPKAAKGKKRKKKPGNKHLMVGKERGAWIDRSDWQGRSPLPWTLSWIPNAGP